MAVTVVDRQILETELVQVAHKMVMAATTAPKARGLNQLHYRILSGYDVKRLSKEMELIGDQTSQHFFIRDSKNILEAPIVVLFGCVINPINLKDCGYCGVINCDEKKSNLTHPCTHNMIDLGIAIGIAADVAAKNHVDNRIMYSAGKAALKLNFFPKEVYVVYAIPLSVSSKNIFFDR